MINYFIIINILAFIICYFDKHLAIKKKFRISEKNLLGICLAGGVFGFFISSKVFRHKTKDKKFLFYYKPILIFWILVLIYLFLC